VASNSGWDNPLTEDAKPKVVKNHVIEVVRHKGNIMLPEAVPLSTVIDVLQKRQQYEEQDVAISAPIEGVFVLDAAYALHCVLKERYGWSMGAPTPSFFGDRPPMLRSVSISKTETVEVPWGRFLIPGVQGFLQSGVDATPDGTYVFSINGVVKRKHEEEINDLVKAVRQYVREHSIYKGKAFRLRLLRDDGERLELPEPVWIDLDESLEHELVFNRKTLRQIGTSIFSVIERTAEVRVLGIPRKRGVLLYGPYGTGKSMTSTVTAIKATRHGWTFVSVDRAEELAEVMRLAREYAPAVVFCEDIDRVMTGKRSTSIDQILNVIDGVESKAAELMVVLTTNDVDSITKAMLRPGRLDATIHVGPPDAEAAEKLVRQYARNLIPEGEDLTEAASVLSGKNAAIIREIVERAKLTALADTPVGDPGTLMERLTITSDALIDSAETMTDQLNLLAEQKPDDRSSHEKAAEILADAIGRTGGTVVPLPLQ
jgi:transitional endoplasmic reticulum ATPase